MTVDVRRKQQATQPAHIKAAMALIKKQRPLSTDVSLSRVGYGRKPQFPLQAVIATDEDKWLEEKLRVLYLEEKPKHATYKLLVQALVTRFMAKYRGVPLDGH